MNKRRILKSLGENGTIWDARDLHEELCLLKDEGLCRLEGKLWFLTDKGKAEISDKPKCPRCNDTYSQLDPETTKGEPCPCQVRG